MVLMIICICFLILGNNEKIDCLINELKQHIEVQNTITKLLKNTRNAPIMLFLNSNCITWGIGMECENEIIDKGRSYSQMNINISDCFFSRTSVYSGDGGVIYTDGGSYSMIINYSMFYSCICSNKGGAIYFVSTNSNLKMICANRCVCGATSIFHFAYFKASQMNQVEYISISNCSHSTSGCFPVYLELGNQRFDNTNNSMNNALSYSGFLINSPTSFTSSHCTFSNNKVSHSVCLRFYSESGTISMSYANIIHNNSPSDHGVVLVDGAGSKKNDVLYF